MSVCTEKVNGYEMFVKSDVCGMITVQQALVAVIFYMLGTFFTNSVFTAFTTS